MHEPRAFGAFDSVEAFIRQQTADFPNVTVIRGFDFVPQDETLYADLRLHPNDVGFDHYADNILKCIQSIG